ncbi:hypothetical protein ACP70R_029260 [Stipagrostis hirtigluma subsp. patula]
MTGAAAAPAESEAEELLHGGCGGAQEHGWPWGGVPLFVVLPWAKEPFFSLLVLALVVPVDEFRHCAASYSHGRRYGWLQRSSCVREEKKRCTDEQGNTDSVVVETSQCVFLLQLWTTQSFLRREFSDQVDNDVGQVAAEQNLFPCKLQFQMRWLGVALPWFAVQVARCNPAIVFWPHYVEPPIGEGGGQARVVAV